MSDLSEYLTEDGWENGEINPYQEPSVEIGLSEEKIDWSNLDIDPYLEEQSFDDEPPEEPDFELSQQEYFLLRKLGEKEKEFIKKYTDFYSFAKSLINAEQEIKKLYNKYHINVKINKDILLKVGKYNLDLDENDKFQENVINSYFNANLIPKGEIYNTYKSFAEELNINYLGLDYVLKEFKGNVNNKHTGDFIRYVDKLFKIWTHNKYKEIFENKEDFNELSYKIFNDLSFFEYTNLLENLSKKEKEIYNKFKVINPLITSFKNGAESLKNFLEKYIGYLYDSIKEYIPNIVKEDIYNDFKDIKNNPLLYVGRLIIESKNIEKTKIGHEPSEKEREKIVDSLKALISADPDYIKPKF